MRASLSEMRIGSLLPLHVQAVTADRKTVRSKTVRSETSAGEATTVDLNDSVIVMKRGRIAGPLVDRGFSSTDRTIDRKGWTGKEARRG
jgi:hypothetical protein